MTVHRTTPTSELRQGYIQIDQAAVQLTTLSYRFAHGVTVKAGSANTGLVYVGGPNVTATNGFELDGGQEIHLMVEDPSGIYVIGSADNQDVSWIGA